MKIYNKLFFLMFCFYLNIFSADSNESCMSVTKRENNCSTYYNKICYFKKGIGLSEGVDDVECRKDLTTGKISCTRILRIEGESGRYLYSNNLHDRIFHDLEREYIAQEKAKKDSQKQ